MTDASTIQAPENFGQSGRRITFSSLVSARFASRLGFAIAVFALGYGWLIHDGGLIDPGDGVGYWLGIIGGVPMILLLFYSLRKRFRFMRYFGATKYWFRAHMIFGIIGPVVILYHCNFNVGSLNSQVALYCTLLVAGSGVIGRYLYTKIHNGLYGRKVSLRELTEQLSKSSDALTSRDGFIDEIRQELGVVVQKVLTPPDSLWHSIWRPVVVGIRTRWLYYQMSWKIRCKLLARSKLSPAVSKHRGRLMRTTQNYLRIHLKQTRQVAQFGTYERLFSLWHIIHVPFFIMMVISALVHVLAVHLY
jgi:hypothetical protein